MKLLLFHFLFLLTLKSFSQLPQTAVYLFDLERNGKTLTLQSPKLVSKRTGYNNQPYFTPDDEFLYFVSSIDSTNVEIYRINLLAKRLKAKRITKTKVPEYSPKCSLDPDIISCVRVEQDDSTQHLALYNVKGKEMGVVLPELKKIGYYEWINQNEFVSFELPEPFYLVHHNINSKRADTLATHIGRTFYFQSTKSRIVFVDKTDSSTWFIKSFSLKQLHNMQKGLKEKPTLISETLSQEEDYCFMQDGSILMGQNGMLYIKKNPSKNPKATWQKLFDLRIMGIEKFYRIAISRDNTKLAVVGFEGKKP
jgi:hypothetical protein